MDSWDFMKGGIKAYENALDALKRELWEEIGCTVFEIKKEFTERLCFQFDSEMANITGFSSQETVMFLVRYPGDKIELSCIDNEIDSVLFFNKDEVINILTNSETKTYWNKFLHDELS